VTTSGISGFPNHPLTKLYEQWRNPPTELIGKIPKGGAQLDYLGHAEVTRALIEADPEWTWEPMAVNEYGAPLVFVNGDTAEMWIRLTVCGTTIPGVDLGADGRERVRRSPRVRER
jgi:hypothetical protein